MYPCIHSFMCPQLVQTYRSAVDDINIALYYPAPHVGFLFGTKKGKIRLARPLRAAFDPTDGWA